jgi:enoyl-CoA hydratase/carnithine racemase
MAAVELERDGFVATLALNRPQERNAWDAESARQITAHAEDLRFDVEVRVVVLRAEGDDFCAGVDVAALADGAPGRSPAERVRNAYERIRFLHERFHVLANLPQPVVVAVQGACLGTGLELALMGDVRIAADDARFALPEPQLGVAVESGGDLRLATEIGAGWAKLLAMTGRCVDAAEAHRLGIVQQVVPRAELTAAARALADEIAANAPLAVQSIKRAVNFWSDRGLAEALRFEAASASVCRVSEDLAAGVRAAAASGDGRPAFEGT